MKKEIRIKTELDKFFRQWLETVSLFKPFSTLRPKEKDVLSQILKHNHLLADIPEKHRWKIVFDYDIKLEIKNSLGMRDESFQNILTSLRKKGFIINNQIPKQYQMYPSVENILAFVYVIEDDTKEG